MKSGEDHQEPPRAWQDQYHQAMLHQDPVAFAVLCEQALPHLSAFLRSRFPNLDGELTDTAAIDCLLSYHARPSQYQPGGLSLFAFLRMAARYDVLNALDQSRRQKRRHVSLENIDQQAHTQDLELASSQMILDELVAQYTRASFTDILGMLEAELDETEKKVLWLMLQGERAMPAFVDALGLNRLDEREQRSEVNRVKDRLAKKLQRLGQRLKRR
jgi:DNA-directed RNA polymerase specialized sigma24 family protein